MDFGWNKNSVNTDLVMLALFPILSSNDILTSSQRKQTEESRLYVYRGTYHHSFRTYCFHRRIHWPHTRTDPSPRLIWIRSNSMKLNYNTCIVGKKVILIPYRKCSFRREGGSERTIVFLSQDGTFLPIGHSTFCIFLFHLSQLSTPSHSIPSQKAHNMSQSIMNG